MAEVAAITATDPSRAALEDALAPSATAEDVGANRPFELAEAETSYVRFGTLDLFLQQYSAGGYGRRRLLGSAGAGTLVWGGGASEVPDGWRLLAVGHAGTQLLRLPTAQLRQLVRPELLAEEVEGFVSGVLGEPAAERASGGTLASPEERIREAGSALAAGIDAAVGKALARDAEDADRIGGEAERERRLLDTALGDLVEVDRKEPLAGVPGDQVARLDVALARIGRHLGVEFPERIDLEDAADPVGTKLAAGGCRGRVVTLRAGWWARPGTVLLGFLTDGDCPVALLPGRSRYLLFDPATARTTRVGPETAARIAATAFVVYPPLPADPGSVGSLLRSVLPRMRGDLWLLLGLGALAGLVTLLTPMVVSIVYNDVLAQGNSALLTAVAALVAGATIVWSVVALSQNLVVVRIEGYLEAEIDPGLMDRLLQLPSEFFRRYATGDLATRAAGLQIIRTQLSGAVVTSFLTLVFSVFNVGLLFAYSPALGAVSLGILAFVIGLIVYLNLRVLRHQRHVYDLTGDVASDLFQFLQAVHKMRIAGAEARLMARWAQCFRPQQRETYAAGRTRSWIFAVITALPAGLVLAMYAVTASVLRDQLSGGSFIGLLTALAQFTAAVTAMTLTMGPLLTVVPLWQRLRPLLDQPLEEVGSRDPGQLSGRISVRDVSFGYRDEAQPVLQNVSFEVRPGEFVAVTGPSGSGKSTLLRLLLGLDHPDLGTVLYDGTDLRALDARAVRHQFGVVMQEARPLPGEILSTILGDTQGNEDDAWRAAEEAQLAEEIRQMPMRMHTIVGEGGLSFSGGQVQRMMIARSLARRPRILLFDEATSALDDRAQAKVSANIHRLDATRVVIAHRLSTIRAADRIYVLDAGRVVQAGTFEELVAEDGIFSRLAARQLV